MFTLCSILGIHYGGIVGYIFRAYLTDLGIFHSGYSKTYSGYIFAHFTSRILNKLFLKSNLNSGSGCFLGFAFALGFFLDLYFCLYCCASVYIYLALLYCINCGCVLIYSLILPLIYAAFKLSKLFRSKSFLIRFYTLFNIVYVYSTGTWNTSVFPFLLIPCSYRYLCIFFSVYLGFWQFYFNNVF